MTRSGPVLAAAIAFLAATPVAAGDEACVACLSNVRPGGERPLQIEVESGIQFSRLALRGRFDGGAEIDPHTGEKRVDAGMIDLGGLSYQGRAPKENSSRPFSSSIATGGRSVTKPDSSASAPSGLRNWTRPGSSMRTGRSGSPVTRARPW